MPCIHPVHQSRHMAIQLWRPAKSVVATADKNAQPKLGRKTRIRRGKREAMALQTLRDPAKEDHRLGGGGKAPERHGVDVFLGGSGAVGPDDVLPLDSGCAIGIGNDDHSGMFHDLAGGLIMADGPWGRANVEALEAL